MHFNSCSGNEDRALQRFLSPYQSPATIPVEFCLDESCYSGLPDYFHPTVKTECQDSGALLTTIAGSWRELEIRVEYITYLDFPVTEWAAFITNNSGKSSPVLSSLKITPLAFPGCNPVMRLGMGDGDVNADDVFRDDLEPLYDTKTVCPIGGLSCNGASPYMRLLFDTYGINIAIGWPAQWRADFSRTAEGTALSVCQYRLNTTIQPGETIRSPRLTLMAFTGPESRGANLWRRWFIKYILTKENGSALGPMVTCSDNPLRWPEDGRSFIYRENSKYKSCTEFELCSAEQQVEGIRNYLTAGFKPDVWWLDAGWYQCEYSWNQTGTWKPNPEQYPDGLHPIGDVCIENNIRFLLWFEPGRIMAGTELDKDHPGWVLRRNGILWQSDRRRMHNFVNQTYLLDYSQQDCREWVTDRLDSIIKEAGAKIYREDLNLNPLGYWVDNEAPDRIGALENAYVTGFLNIWKEIIRRNPGIWIDSCASGGRRNDLETLRTPAVPLHYTDHSYGNHPQKEGHSRYMHQWIPYFKGHNSADWDDENGHYHHYFMNVKYDAEYNIKRPNSMFSYYTSMGPMFSASFNYQDSDEIKYYMHLAQIAYRAGSIMLSGDYYPLTEFKRSEYEWFSDQFDAGGEGYILFIRNTCAEAEELTVHPYLDKTASYCFENSETGETFELSGDDACKGILMKLPKRNGTILFYKKMQIVKAE
jgi:alpha-galactosidase